MLWGLSWLTRLCNIAWRLGTVPLVWQTGVVVPLFKRGPESVFQLHRGITLLSLPGKVYARVLERRIRPIVDPRIQEEQCGFRPGRGTLDQLYTLHRVLEGLWEFAQPVHMCFVDLEKAFDRVPCGILWGVLREYGVREAFAKGCSVSVRPEQELGSHCRQPGPSACTGAVCSRECEAAGMRISTSKSMVLDRKRVACPLQVGGERSCLKWRNSNKYLGVLFTSEGKIGA
ncbi:hypothetical protein L3Q82_015670 [Scortum barcoo]|uniref:Uncharacterized protein n=1 Tax=Scortum barcoo TaxID=214431 RepID=A0ACB8VP04_9TELE|nr:hypothetical protein L3Q82_015670 [Scortum barcoo]